MKIKMKKIQNILHLSESFLVTECNITFKALERACENKAIKPISICNEKFYNFHALTKPMSLAVNELFSYETLIGLCDKESLTDDVSLLTDKIQYVVGYTFAEKIDKIIELTGFPQKKCVAIAKKWVATEWFLNNHRQSPSSRLIRFEVFKNVFPDSKLKTIGSLDNWFTRCKKEGIENVIIDKRKDNSSPKKVTDDVLFFIAEYAKLDKHYSAPQITKKIAPICAAAGRHLPAPRTVRKIVAELLKNPAFIKERLGEKEVAKRQVFAKILPALNVHSQWQCDGKVIGLVCEDGKRYWLYLIFDNHSEKIIGWNVGPSENTPLILESLDDTIRETGFIPYQFVFDKHGFHRTQVGQRFTANVQELGSVITATTVAERKRTCEYGNKYIDAGLKDYFGFLGQSPMGKNKYKGPKPEKMLEYIKPSNTYTPDELTVICASIITEYHNTPLPHREGKTPNQLYDESENKHGIPVSEELRTKIIKPATLYTVRRGQVTIQQGTVRHEFQLYGTFIDDYEDKQVKVVFEDLRDGIYLYDAVTDAFIVALEPKKAIHGALADQNDDDRQRLFELNGKRKGVEARAKKKKDDIIRNALKMNPDIIDLIAPYLVDKDVRTEAQRNAAIQKILADKNVNLNKLPFRKQASNLSEIPDDNKRRGSVFHPKETKEKLKFFKPDEQGED